MVDEFIRTENAITILDMYTKDIMNFRLILVPKEFTTFCPLYLSFESIYLELVLFKLLLVYCMCKILLRGVIIFILALYHCICGILIYIFLKIPKTHYEVYIAVNFISLHHWYILYLPSRLLYIITTTISIYSFNCSYIP